MAKAETDGFASVIGSLKALSAEELAEVITAARREREAKIEEERQKLRAEFEQRAAKLNLSVADVMRETDKGKKKIAVVYRGPNGEEWSGRGKVPKWLTVLEASGRGREEFKV